MRPLNERLRYVLLRGSLIKQGDEWVWIAAPDVKCEVRELRNESKWVVVEFAYDALRGIRI
jgi:hypothetical protein